MAYISLIIGFIFLVKGADFFVSGSSTIAEHFGIPTFIIGLTIVAFGTSMPEAAISVTAAMTGANGIAVGNAIGSNMFNLLIVLGASSLIKECPITRDTLRFEYPLSVAAAGALLVMGLRAGADGSMFGTGIVSRVDGLVLLTVFTVFMVMTVKKAMKQHNRENIIDYYGGADVGDPEIEVIEEERQSLIKSIIKSIIGLAGIVFGGDLVVDSATSIATAFGIDEILIGLTIVALGTSLPELVISIVAALKGETDIAVGNVIGSNIFNILLVLGLSTAIHPIAITMFSIYDILILIGASFIVLIPLARKQVITRGWGTLMVLLYAGYLAYIIARTL